MSGVLVGMHCAVNKEGLRMNDGFVSALCSAVARLIIMYQLSYTPCNTASSTLHDTPALRRTSATAPSRVMVFYELFYLLDLRHEQTHHDRNIYLFMIMTKLVYEWVF